MQDFDALFYSFVDAIGEVWGCLRSNDASGRKAGAKKPLYALRECPSRATTDIIKQL